MSQTKAQLVGGVGISTAESLVVGAAATIHTGGFRIGASDLHSTGISLVNVNATGIVTASSFIGNVTGTASTASFATTSFSLQGTPSLSVGIVTVTGLGGVAYAGITSTAISKTLINREYCTVVSAGVTVTLPASPSPGWEVGIAVGNFTDVVVGRNGSNIMALAENFTMDKAYLALQFVYIDSVQGWRFF